LQSLEALPDHVCRGPHFLQLSYRMSEYIQIVFGLLRELGNSYRACNKGMNAMPQYSM
jgi:hypothetical protein